MHHLSFPRWLIVVAFAIVLNILFETGLGAFLTPPRVGEFCREEQVRVIPQKKDECTEIGGEWVPEVYVQRGLPKPEALEPAPIEVARKGYCNVEATCLGEYQAAALSHEQKIFSWFVILGVLSLGLGRIFVRYGVPAAGFFAGGLFSFGIAAARYWPFMSDGARVLILAAVLAFLILLGRKKEKSSVHAEEKSKREEDL